MKLLLVLAASIAWCAGSAIPLIPGDNSHYVEGVSRYIWIPDGNEVPILVDLQEPVVEDNLETGRNGARNAYWLYTRSNPNSPDRLISGDESSILNSHYDSKKPLKVIVHGWQSDLRSNVNVYVKEAFLVADDVNVIVLDWSHVAGNINYLSAARGVPEIGQYLAGFLDWLIQTVGGDWRRVHLVGHSLGAHLVGNTGRTLNGRPARITGLDPAGPTWGNNARALKASDGVYVEAIHTDGGLLGIFDKIADADFYPNGGRNPQPGCILSNCSHSRAYQIFAASVQYNHFDAIACETTRHAEKGECNGHNFKMGNSDLSKYGSGIFYVPTGGSWPY